MEQKIAEPKPSYADEVDLEQWAKILEEQMKQASITMDFERAAQLRDELFEVKAKLGL